MSTVKMQHHFQRLASLADLIMLHWFRIARSFHQVMGNLRDRLAVKMVMLHFVKKTKMGRDHICFDAPICSIFYTHTYETVVDKYRVEFLPISCIKMG